jgi:hypothetical protein
MVIHGDHAEEVIVRFGYRLAGPVLVDIADLELLEVTTEGPFESVHDLVWPSARRDRDLLVDQCRQRSGRKRDRRAGK